MSFRLATQELLKDAKRFKDKRDAEFRATQMKRPMRTNKPFLKNTLRDVLSFNKKRSQNTNEKPLKRKLLNKGVSHKYAIKMNKKPKQKIDEDVNKNKEIENKERNKTTSNSSKK